MNELAASPTAAATPPARRRLYTAVRMSMWAWRQHVRRALMNFATTDLPAGKQRRDWKAKAAAFSACGRTLSALACGGCSNVNLSSGTIVATCGLRICPICARRRAEKLRSRLVKAWDQMERGRRDGLYFLTFTLRYDPGDPAQLTAEGLLARKNTAMAAWASVWRQYLKKRGKAACRAVEVGASGMIHLHVLYVGRRPDIGDLRYAWLLNAPTSPMVNVRYVGGNVRKAIVELAKYVTKGASPAKGDIAAGRPGAFMDPELAARVEIAFSGDRLVQCYGSWLGISVDDDEETEEERLSDEKLHGASCPHCGLVGEWRTINFALDEWFEKYGAELADWRPRIGGSGPRKKGETENEQRHPSERRRSWQPNQQPRGRRASRERARELIDRAVAKLPTYERPAWTRGAARLDQ